MLEETGENSATGTYLLRGANTFASELSSDAVGVTLRRVVVADKRGQTAETRAQVNVQGIAVMTKLIPKESSSGRVNEPIDKVGLDRNNRAAWKLAAKSIAIREPKSGNKVVRTDSGGKQMRPGSVVPADNRTESKLTMTSKG